MTQQVRDGLIEALVTNTTAITADGPCAEGANHRPDPVRAGSRLCRNRLVGWCQMRVAEMDEALTVGGLMAVSGSRVRRPVLAVAIRSVSALPLTLGEP